MTPPVLTAVEVCAGAGGQSLGLHLAGFDHQVAVELDRTAAATLETNLERLGLQDRVRVGDVADDRVWQPHTFDGIDLFAGGVPCPPFSIAGKKLGATDERDLFAWAIEKAANEIRPRVIMLENVRGLLGSPFDGYRQHVLDRLQKLGYTPFWKLLFSSDFGVPQHRPRSVLIALTPDVAPYFRWPETTGKLTTVGATLVNSMASNGWRSAEGWSRGAMEVGPTIVGGSKKHGGADLGPRGAKRAWERLGVDGHGIADEPPPATSPADHSPRLTTEMVSRLQGWRRSGPYRWDFIGRKTSVYRQIGNAFPPPVARALGIQIASALRNEGEARELPVLPDKQDSVYRALREAGDYMSVSGIAAQLGLNSSKSVLEHLKHLQRDFVLEEQEVNGEPTFRLVDFRAFRGERNHDRHQRFSASVSKVS